MKIRYICSIVAAIIIIIILYWIIKNDMRSNDTMESGYSYYAVYPNENMSFECQYKGESKVGELEYNSFGATLAEYDPKSDKDPVYQERILIIYVDGQSIEAKNITPEFIKQYGAKFKNTADGRIVWYIDSPSGHNPSYRLSGTFWKGFNISIGISVRNPPDPDMEKPVPCPFSFSFMEGQKPITFPITRKQLEAMFGPPPKEGKSLIWDV